MPKKISLAQYAETFLCKIVGYLKLQETTSSSSKLQISITLKYLGVDKCNQLGRTEVAVNELIR